MLFVNEKKVLLLTVENHVVCKCKKVLLLTEVNHVVCKCKKSTTTYSSKSCCL
jgi:hypothetical protein